MDKPFSPAADRNKSVIFDVLLPYLEAFEKPIVLEVGAATGQHALFFTENTPKLQWVVSDQKMWWNHLTSLVNEANLIGPFEYESGKTELPKVKAQILYSCNTLHIMSWEKAKIFLKQAADFLPPQGIFFYYGPFNEGEKFTAPSNEAFDLKLKNENPEMGIRDRFEVQKILEANGLNLLKIQSMPANNFSIVFKKN